MICLLGMQNSLTFIVREIIYGAQLVTPSELLEGCGVKKWFVRKIGRGGGGGGGGWGRRGWRLQRRGGGRGGG